MEVCGFLMVKHPKLSPVKQRITRELDSSIAVDLYRNFVLDTVSTIRKMKWPIMIAFHPRSALSEFQMWLGDDLEYFPQQGKDLGERLQNGFAQTFHQGYQGAMAIASDCPDLPPYILNQARRQLGHHDVVLGSSHDGGYYLIGFQSGKYTPEVFQGITWSTNTVFEETAKKLKQHNRHMHLLPAWRDIDTLADLKRFFEDNQNHPMRAAYTMNYLREHPNILAHEAP